MEYRQFPAPADLTPWVECLWTLRGTIAPQGQTILPDGRMELVFHFLNAPRDSSGAEQPPALIAGQIRSALALQPNGPVDAVGIRLRPGAGGRLVPAALLAGKCHDMEAVLPAWARHAREQSGNAPHRVHTLLGALRSLLLPNTSPPDAAVEFSIGRIEADHGLGPIERYLPHGLSLRQWERRFTAAAGLPPKALARIVRLQHLVSLHESGQFRRWADLALECGFYDQAHLANDFRAFAGQSPEAFFRQGRGMAEFYRDGNLQDTAPRRR